MKEQLWYVVECGEIQYIFFNDMKKAVEKQTELLMNIRKPVGLRVLAQGTLEEYLSKGFNNKTIES